MEIRCGSLVICVLFRQTWHTYAAQTVILLLGTGHRVPEVPLSGHFDAEDRPTSTASASGVLEVVSDPRTAVVVQRRPLPQLRQSESCSVDRGRNLFVPRHKRGITHVNAFVGVLGLLGSFFFLGKQGCGGACP